MLMSMTSVNVQSMQKTALFKATLNKYPKQEPIESQQCSRDTPEFGGRTHSTQGYIQAPQQMILSHKPVGS